MNESLFYESPSWVVALLLFFGMITIHWVGYKFRISEVKKTNISSNDGINAITTSLLGLLALLLSFTFNMAASRYDNRRNIIIEESNAIRTVVTRADLYPENVKKQLKSHLNDYLNCRIKYYKAVIDSAEIDRSKKELLVIFAEIWNQITVDSQNPLNSIRSQQMIPALNDMINIADKRDAIKNATVPNAIWKILFTIILFASFTVGYSNIGKQKNHILALVFSLSVVFAVYLILNLDRPRRGPINLNSTEKNIVDLKYLFKE